ncbi:MAG: hypothetical protein II763_05690 [Bacteroidales bacterium]|nr:hypothetical protein [Bacteroidales bacterium]
MRKLLLTLLASVLSLTAFSGGIPLLDKVEGHRVVFHYTYLLSRDGKPMEAVTDGDVVVEDNAYRMQGLGLEVISDGATRWSKDPEAEEVVIEKVEKEDLFTNPALFIRSYRQYMDKLKVNSSSSDALDVTLTLDENTRARFVLTGIKFLEKQGKSDFVLDTKSLGKSYVITDLR